MLSCCIATQAKARCSVQQRVAASMARLGAAALWTAGTAARVALLAGVLWLAAAGVAAAEQHSQQQRQEAFEPVCRGLSGSTVDWWVMLKHPQGYEYSYLDSNTIWSDACAADGICWIQGHTLLSNSSPVASTLRVLLLAQQEAVVQRGGGSAQQQAPQPQQRQWWQQQQEDNEAVAYALYNNEDPPGVEHFSAAHAKGVVAFGPSCGFWLVHSVPRWPRSPAEGPDFADLLRPQSVFGQHFSCFSLGQGAVETVAALLGASGPYIYDAVLPGALAAAYPSWLRLLGPHRVNDTAAHAVEAQLVTVGGERLRVFAKTAALVARMTDDVVGAALGTSMLWETWRRTHDALPSACVPEVAFGSLNIARIRIPGSIYGWPWALDHAKWGVSCRGPATTVTASNASNNSAAGSVRLGASSRDSSWVRGANGLGTGEGVVCLGDMNRGAWQEHRGGGFVCMRHAGLWRAFRGLVAVVERCSGGAVTPDICDADIPVPAL